MRFLAAVLVALEQPLALEELELAPLEYGQVLVRLQVSGICGSQLGEIAGVKGPDPHLPHLLGHEGTGEVLECGPGVRQVTPGDRVVLHWRPGAGIESPTPSYRHPRWGRVNSGWVTTFNRLAVVSENRLTRVPAALDPEHGALLGCAVTTAFGVVNRDAGVGIGESVAVLGAGGVGLSLVQGACLAGAWPIVAVDRFPSKLDLARRLGASHTQLGLDEPALAALVPGGFDVVLETTGAAELIEAAYRLGRRTVLVGVPPAGQTAALYTLPLHFEKRLTGSHGGGAQPHRDIPRYLRLLEAGRLDLGPLITDRYPLESVNAALDAVRAGQVAGRCLLTM